MKIRLIAAASALAVAVVSILPFCTTATSPDGSKVTSWNVSPEQLAAAAALAQSLKSKQAAPAVRAEK